MTKTRTHRETNEALDDMLKGLRGPSLDKVLANQKAPHSKKFLFRLTVELYTYIKSQPPGWVHETLEAAMHKAQAK